MAGPLILQRWLVTVPLHLLAILSTGFRLYRRRSKRQLWWDDYWATIALVLDLIFMVTPLLRYAETNPPKIRLLARFWLGAMLFPLVVWTARVSIGMSIARLVPPKTTTRRLLYVMNASFAFMCAILLAQKIWVCLRNTSWINNRGAQCYLGSTIGIITLCTDVVADACLVTVPLSMLWHVRLPSKQRRLILSIFASSILSSMVGIVYAVFVFKARVDRTRWASRLGIFVHIKAAATLLVCNLLVIVTYLYCTYWKADGDDEITEPSETRSKPNGPVPHTTTLLLTEISDMATLESRITSANIRTLSPTSDVL